MRWNCCIVKYSVVYFSARVYFSFEKFCFELPVKMWGVDRFFQVMQLPVKPLGNKAAIRVLCISHAISLAIFSLLDVALRNRKYFMSHWSEKNSCLKTCWCSAPCTVPTLSLPLLTNSLGSVGAQESAGFLECFSLCSVMLVYAWYMES